MKIVKPSVTLLMHTPALAKLIEQCGRVCYKSEDKITPESAETFIRMILGRQHDSVTEHASATMLFVCDRGVSHEIVRHRVASYSQESTRYCNYGKDKFGNEITVICPFPLLTNDSTAEERMRMGEWISAVHAAETAYLNLIQSGCSPQIARSVLPTCLKTEIAVTMNMREWRWFLRKRLPPEAHPQMREVAAMARDILVDLSPAMFEEFKPVRMEEPGDIQ